jgi:hypothetical protein
VRVIAPRAGDGAVAAMQWDPRPIGERPGQQRLLVLRCAASPHGAGAATTPLYLHRAQLDDDDVGGSDGGGGGGGGGGEELCTPVGDTLGPLTAAAWLPEPEAAAAAGTGEGEGEGQARLVVARRAGAIVGLLVTLQSGKFRLLPDVAIEPLPPGQLWASVPAGMEADVAADGSVRAAERRARVETLSDPQLRYELELCSWPEAGPLPPSADRAQLLRARLEAPLPRLFWGSGDDAHYKTEEDVRWHLRFPDAALVGGRNVDDKSDSLRRFVKLGLRARSASLLTFVDARTLLACWQVDDALLESGDFTGDCDSLANSARLEERNRALLQAAIFEQKAPAAATALALPAAAAARGWQWAPDAATRGEAERTASETAAADAGAAAGGFSLLLAAAPLYLQRSREDFRAAIREAGVDRAYRYKFEVA